MPASSVPKTGAGPISVSASGKQREQRDAEQRPNRIADQPGDQPGPHGIGEEEGTRRRATRRSSQEG